jgi:hypothetical protein
MIKVGSLFDPLASPAHKVKRTDVRNLQYITRIENVSSIVKHGLLSNRLATPLNPVSVSDSEVQERREERRVPEGLPLHDYVNLFFHAHNPMLSSRRALNDWICVLEVLPSVLDFPGVVVTDRNAAKDGVNFCKVEEGLRKLDRGLVYARYWVSRDWEDDPEESERRELPKSAEVLVPHKVPPEFLTATALVSNGIAHKRLTTRAPALKIVVSPGFFF